jgi:hypothetical protein
LGAVSYANRAHDSGTFQLTTIVTTTRMTIIIAIVGVSLGVARRDEPRMTNRMAYHHRRGTHWHRWTNHNDRRRADWTRSHDHRGRAHRTSRNDDRRWARRRCGNHNARNVRQWEADADIERHTSVSRRGHGTRNTEGSQSKENFRFHTCKVRRSIQGALQKWPIETGSASINSINGERNYLQSGS